MYKSLSLTLLSWVRKTWLHIHRRNNKGRCISNQLQNLPLNLAFILCTRALCPNIINTKADRALLIVWEVFIAQQQLVAQRLLILYAKVWRLCCYGVSSLILLICAFVKRSQVFLFLGVKCEDRCQSLLQTYTRKISRWVHKQGDSLHGKSWNVQFLKKKWQRLFDGCN